MVAIPRPQKRRFLAGLHPILLSSLPYEVFLDESSTYITTFGRPGRVFSSLTRKIPVSLIYAEVLIC